MTAFTPNSAVYFSLSGLTSVSFGSPTVFCNIHKPNTFVSHHGDHSLLPSDNTTLSSFDPSFLKAKLSLENRLSAVWDISTPYMKSFVSSTHAPSSINKKTVVFLHDFFDSPHIYRSMLHVDFYSWIIDTIECLIENKRHVFLKPHPNQCIKSESVVNMLKHDYESSEYVHWLDKNLSNSAIFQQKPALVVSVYGSVIVEAAYCGIRVLTAGDHPYINYNIATSPSTIDSYKFFLLNPAETVIPDIDDTIRSVANRFQQAYDSNRSLISFLQVNIDKLYEDASILSSFPAHQYLDSQLTRLLDTLSV